MNNEPVAWMDKRTNKCVVFINTPPSDDWIPLYTHPVELTDEEIMQTYQTKYCAIKSMTIKKAEYLNLLEQY